MYYTYYRVAPSEQLVTDLEKALNGQYTAIACYEKLAELAKDEEEKKTILEIREDEKRHYAGISQIYTGLTGKQPNPEQTEECASDYVAGLNAAIKDEQETVDFYNGIADRAQDPYVRRQFRRFAADEQNHAVWFLYFLTKNK